MLRDRLDKVLVGISILHSKFIFLVVIHVHDILTTQMVFHATKTFKHIWKELHYKLSEENIDYQ